MSFIEFLEALCRIADLADCTHDDYVKNWRRDHSALSTKLTEVLKTLGRLQAN
jgi:hypothetical protein